jgi:CheY-like chemotaxis protein
MLTASMGRTLLDALRRADGDLLSFRVGAKPYVRNAAGRIEIGTRDLPAHVVHAVFGGFLPPDAQAPLSRSGCADCVLPLQDGFRAEHLSATAVQNDVLTVEIRRRRPGAAAETRPANLKAAPLLLLIDGSTDRLDLYGLQEWYRVLSAESGLKGLQMAQAEQPDVIVCDPAMRATDGWDMCRRLRAHPGTAAIPLIILTARADAELAKNAASVGAQSVVIKPCSVDILRLRIDDAVVWPRLPQGCCASHVRPKPSTFRSTMC